MDNAAISVIVPIYNVEEYLPQCLESIVNQTMRNLEIILVDDCGTDGSMKIAEQYAERDERITIIRHAVNRGISAARNTGIANSSAPYIMFVDSDDYVAPAFCEKLYGAIMSSRADIAMCGVEVFGQAHEKMKTMKRYFHFRFPHTTALDETVITKTNCCVWNKIYRRDLIIEHNMQFPIGLKHEDEYWWRIYAIYSHCMIYVEDKLYYYRQRAGSIMADVRAKQNMNQDIMKIGMVLYCDIVKRGLHDYRMFAIDFFLCMTINLLIENDENGRKDILKQAAAFIRSANITESECSLCGQRILRMFITGQIEPEKQYLGGIVTIREKMYKRTVKLFGITVWRERYYKMHAVGKLFGLIPLKIRRKH